MILMVLWLNQCNSVSLILTLMGLVAEVSLRVSFEKHSDLHECFVGGESYSASFCFHVNEWLAFWLFLIASSYFLLRKTVNYFLRRRIKPAEEVSLAKPNARIENDVADNLSSLKKPNARIENEVADNLSSSKNKCDAYSEVSDFERGSYLHSLLNLEEEDSEWLLDENPSDSPENLSNVEEFNAGDEPLFWPSEGELNWDSEEPSFCNSPRRKVVFDSRRSNTSRIKGCEQKNHETFVDESFDAKKDDVLGRELYHFALGGEVPIETLVGLKEFDGHEGLDLEFDGELFMLEKSLQ